MNISFSIIQKRKKGINYILGLSFVFSFIPILISKNISWDIMKWFTLSAILVFVITSIYDKNSRKVIGELTFNSDSVKLEIKGIIRTILVSEILSLTISSLSYRGENNLFKNLNFTYEDGKQNEIEIKLKNQNTYLINIFLENKKRKIQFEQLVENFNNSIF